jgi:hypothetical protein
MGSQEFATPVRGSGSTPIQTNAQGAIETDNYRQGGGFDFDGSAYPYTVDPTDFDIQVIHITKASDIVLEITTLTGNTFDVPLAGGSGVIDWIEVDNFTLKDPNNTNARVAGSYGGEE